MTSSITSLIFEGAAMSHPFQIDNSRMIGEGVKLELISGNYGTLKKKHALVYDLCYVFLFIPLQNTNEHHGLLSEDQGCETGSIGSDNKA